jgi:hypothetical protein
MTIKSFERSIIEISDHLVFKKAKLIDNEYKLDIRELNAEDKLAFVSKILSINSNLDNIMQEYIDDACSNRLCAESDIFGSWYDDE